MAGATNPGQDGDAGRNQRTDAMAPVSYSDTIRAVVDEAPELSADQQAQIAVLLRIPVRDTVNGAA